MSGRKELIATSIVIDVAHYFLQHSAESFYPLDLSQRLGKSESSVRYAVDKLETIGLIKLLGFERSKGVARMQYQAADRAALEKIVRTGAVLRLEAALRVADYLPEETKKKLLQCFQDTQS